MNQEQIEERRYAPKDSRAIRFSDLPGAVVFVDGPYKNGRFGAAGYSQRAFNPTTNYSYRTEEQRDKAVAEFFDNLRAHESRKAERKAERKADTRPSVADELRAKLKAAGFNSRRVTVKHDHFSMGSSLDVTIRDPDADFQAIKKIASEFEHIDRCPYSGEILSGGNRYLHVTWGADATETRRDRVRSAVLTAIEKGKAMDLKADQSIEIDGHPWLIGPGRHSQGFALHATTPGTVNSYRDAYDAETAVSIVARA